MSQPYQKMYPMSSTLPFLVRLGALALLLILPCVRGRAAAPLSTNDTCASAVTIPAAGPFPYWTAVIDISNATTNGDPVLISGEGTNSINYATSLVHSVWFKFTPSVTALYTLSLGADTLTTIDDTVMAVYRATGGTCGGATNLYDWADDPGTLHAALTTNFTGGTTYYIVAWVGPIEELTNQPLNLQLRVTKPVAPTIDECSAASIISAATLAPVLTFTNDNTLATDNASDLIASCISGSRNIWHKFTPTNTAYYFFSDGADTATTVDDPALALFRGTCGSLTNVACNDGLFARDLISARLTNGITYYLSVYDNSFDPVPGETSVQIRAGRVTAPTVQTLGVTGLTTTGAVLYASVNPNGSANSAGGANSRYWFEWGATTNYTSTNAPRLLALSSTSILSTASITGLTAGVLYHYRVVATNIIDKSFGGDRTLQWSALQPVLTSPVLLTNSEFQFQFTAASNQLYMVQGSTNLPAWFDIGLASEHLPGQFQFNESSLFNPRFLFYKLRLP